MPKSTDFQTIVGIDIAKSVFQVYFKETMIDARGTACKHCYGGFAFRQPSRNNSGIKGRDLGENAFRF